MRLKILKMSYSALKENKLRFLLTTLGIVIGTAIVIIVLSVGAGIKSLILEQITSITPEMLFVEIQVPSNKTGLAQDSQTGESIGGGVQITTLTLDDMEDVARNPNISDTYAMIISQAKLTAGSKEKTAMVFSVTEGYQRIESVQMAEGRFYTNDEDRNLAKVIVLGSTVKEKLFGISDAVGQRVKINNQTFKVVGVADEIGTKFFLNMDELVYIPVRTTQKLILGTDHIQAMAMLMYDSEKIFSTIPQVEKQIRKNHKITDPEKDDFVVRTQEESMEIIDTVTGGISMLLFALAAISLIVGGVGIMNVMYVSVSERTHEIGLKKAVGAKPYAIRFQFIAEAIIITAIGGALGIVLGLIISWLVSFVAGLLDFNWPFVVELTTIIFALTVSVVIGIGFGYAPANKAAKLDPINALRK